MEIITFGEQNKKPPLLFVHGSFCGAWIWDRYFLPHFAQEGYHGAAISLRGHGKHEDIDDLDSFGVDDFLEDIAEGVKLFETPPILVGHSLGGYLIQRYALDHEVAGMILLASPALSGLAASSQHIMMHSPDLAMQLGILMACGKSSVDTAVLARALLTKETPEEDGVFLAENFQRESSRVTKEAFFPCLRLPQGFPKTLIIGGDADAFVPTNDLQYSRMLWAAELKMMKSVPHGLMIDPCWREVAKTMREWIDKNY